MIGKKKKIVFQKSAFASNLDAGISGFRNVKKINEDYTDFPDHAGLTSYQKRKIETSSITNRIYLGTSNKNKSRALGNNISNVGELLK